MLSGNSLV